MMKRLFILLFILCSLSGYGQTVTQYIGTKTNTVLTQGSHKVDSALYLPTGTKYAPTWAGAIRYNAADSALYHWTGYNWRKSGGTSVDSFTYATRARVLKQLDSLKATVPTLYTQNGTIPAFTTRTVTLGPAASLDVVQGTNKITYISTGKFVSYQGFTTGNSYSMVEVDSGKVFMQTHWEDGAAYKGADITLTNTQEEKSMILAFGGSGGTVNSRIKMDSSGLYLQRYNGEWEGISITGSGVSGGGASLPTLSTLTYGATTTWDYSTQGTEAKVTLTGNTTLSITNLPAGVAYLTLEVIQDATGSRTITLPAGTKVIGGGAGAVTLTTTGSATDLITFRWNGTTLFANLGTNYN